MKKSEFLAIENDIVNNNLGWIAESLKEEILKNPNWGEAEMQAKLTEKIVIASVTATLQTLMKTGFLKLEE